MGTVRKRKTKKGIKYRAEICVNGIRDSKTFDDDIDARIWIRDRERQLQTGEYKEEELAPNDERFSLAIENFIIETRKTVSPAQSKNYEYIKRPIIRYFGKAKMSEIKKNDVAAYVLERTQEVGVSSIRNELSLIRRVYEHAHNWGVCFESPEKDIKRPRHKMPSREDRQDKVISPQEIKAIFEEARQRKNNLYLYLKFLLYTGMRPTEAALLYWDRLPAKAEKNAISKVLPIGFVDSQRGGFSRIGTKTETRFVPAHPEVWEIIDELEKHRGKDDAGNPNKLVFLENKYEGRRDAYKYYRRSFKTTIDNARIFTPAEASQVGEIKRQGLGPIALSTKLKEFGNPILKDINFYSFRHTCRSNMGKCGIPTEIAETIIGHQDKSFKFTYIHLDDQVLIDEIRKLDFGL